MRLNFIAVIAAASCASAAHGQGDWYTVQDPVAVIPRHAVLLPPTTFDRQYFSQGLVLYFQATSPTGVARPILWDPVSQKDIGQTAEPQSRLFCSGHAFDGFGDLVFAGGACPPPTNICCGNENVVVFDPLALEGNPITADMVDARFYPSCVTTADGRVWIFGGNRWGGQRCNVRNPDVEWVDFSQRPYAVVKENVSLSPAPPNYPMTYLLGTAADGDIAFVGPSAGEEGDEETNTYWYDTTSPTQNLVQGPATALSVHHGQATGRFNTTSVLLPIDLRQSPVVEEVLVIGGGSGGSLEPTCEILFFNDQATPPDWEWAFTGDPDVPSDPGNLRHPRRRADAVLLADGTPFLVGGVEEGRYTCPIFTPEVFDRANSEWIALEDQFGKPLDHEHPRGYHSVALLLPDGSVWVAGQDEDWECGGKTHPHDGTIVEIYRPWYMFVDRPEILDIDPPSGPNDRLPRNQTFNVEYDPHGKGFGHVAIISLASVTHSVNFSQRYVILESNDHPSIPNTQVVDVPEAKFAPPGPYMLVVVDDAGVPSVAEFIYLDF